MKHILRKLHIGGGHDSLDGRAGHDGGATTPSSSSSVPSFSELGTPEPRVSSTGLSGWWRHTGGRSRFENNTGNAGNVSSLRPVDDSAATSVAPAVQEEEEGGGGPMDFNFYEEEFQVQMALALSASNNDVHNDPESLQIRAAKRISLGRPPSPGNTVDELFSYRYWAYNVLDYSEKVVDGFYDVYGVAADFEASEKMPSLVDLQGTPASGDLGYEVVLVNRTIDPDLVQLEQTALCLAVDCESSDINQRQTMLVQKIADLVAGHMGGPVIDANLMLRRWQKKSYGLRSSLNNIVLPLGCLQIGLSRHRALLFKVLADHVGIACRLVKGSHYTGTDEGAVNIIKFDDEREYILDLMGAPGTLLPPESGGGFYAGEENMDFRLGTLTQADVSAGASNKRQGKSGSVEEDYAAKVGRMISKNWEHVLHSETEMEDPLESFGGSQPRVFSPDLASNIIDSSCTFVKDNTQSTEESRTANVGHSAETMLNAPTLNRNGFVTGEAKADASTSNWNVAQELSLKKVPVSPRGTDLQLASTAVRLSNMRDRSNPIGRNQKRNGSEATSHSGNTESYLSHGPSENACKRKDHDKEQTDDRSVLTHQNETVHSKRDNVFEDVAEWEIPWEEITIGGRIGLGSYGEVYHGDWHDREVAVKKFLDQDLSGDALDEFRREVRIMRRMSHPNVVLFMGAVTRPPNLSIVTEYLPRGSLFRLIHRPSPVLDEKRRLRMALDVAKGMNYLHTSTPIIVHRDLKSPNLLVDKNWVVKVCDFGLSRMKHHTFLSSKSTAGTPEWMAPEVLRNEPSNEKCDVYSFGVILWELVTLQQPWSGMNPMQVVGAVGFQSRHLTIPENVDPLVSKVIQECWRSEPGLRPSFSQLILALEPLQRLTVLEMDTRR